MPNGICPFAEQVTGVTKFAPQGPAKVGFCDHTAGGFYTTLARASFWNGAGYSVHFGIARDGRICQIVNIFDRAWGQGRLGPTVSWPPYQTMNRVNPNEYLISIEHEDAETVNGRTRFIPGSQWTDEMYAADVRLKRWCIEEYQRVKGIDLMRFGIDSLAGHHMFDSVSRAECPGKFWRNEYRQRIYNDLRTQGGNEEMVYTPLNGIANPDWWEVDGGKQIGNGQWCAAYQDWPELLPARAMLIRIQVWSDGVVTAHHGSSGLDAGRTHNGYGTMDVILNEHGHFWFQAGDTTAARIKRLAILGYWS